VRQDDPVRAEGVRGPARGRPSRVHNAVFLPLGDEGRAELVERRIADAITGGVLAAGERLPSEAEMARSMRVALMTVREALVALRRRGLVVTRRGRNGGSFVTARADRTELATRRLGDMTRTALRDLAAHYLAIGEACLRLAAARAHPSEVDLLVERLEHLDLVGWSRTLDELRVEVAALSQSARLTREYMTLQAEISPLLALADDVEEFRAGQAAALERVLAAVRAGDAQAAVSAFDADVQHKVDWLVRRHRVLQQEGA
ncbi:GntR family transcriptional regulator, partial [Georgenia ruanii]|nr:GntR family transcriptional regulator [Georgenia ruanii]